MNKPFLYAMGPAVGVCLMLGACAPTSPRLDDRMGESVRTAVAQQTLNPDAATKNVPESLDGMVARDNIGQYRTSMRQPAQSTDGYTIGLGSGRSR